MKSVQVTAYGGPEVLRWVDVPDVLPEPDLLKVRVELASVNFADTMARRGRYLASQPPFTTGIDFMGVVIDAPHEHEALLGRRVIGFGDGTMAEEISVDASMVAPIDDSIDPLVAAAAPLVLCTSLELIDRAGRLKPGERVAIYAASGGVGRTLIRLARAYGAGEIFALVGNSDKAQQSLEVGADHALIYRGPDAVDYSAEILSKTDGHGVDLIFNSVAGTTFDSDFKMMANFGRLVVFGISSGDPGNAPSNLLHPTSRSVIGYSFSNLRRNRPYEVKPVLRRAVDQLEQGIEFEIAGVFPPVAADRAHQLLESGESSGKILIDFRNL